MESQQRQPPKRQNPTEREPEPGGEEKDGNLGHPGFSDPEKEILTPSGDQSQAVEE